MTGFGYPGGDFVLIQPSPRRRILSKALNAQVSTLIPPFKKYPSFSNEVVIIVALDLLVNYFLGAFAGNGENDGLVTQR